MEDLSPQGPLTPEAPKPSPEKKGLTTFECPACGGVITLRASGQTLTAVCSHCSSVIDVTNQNYKIIQTANEKERDTLLPMGLRGTLFDMEWEVIGYTQKSDSTGDYLWDEYLLFNPYSGFRFLVQAEGHWSFVTMMKEIPEFHGSAVKCLFQKEEYKIFLRDRSTVTYVKGEFYWRVKKGDAVEETDYVRPPYMLTIEDSSQEKVVSRGVYVEPKDVESAFGINPSSLMPRRKGVAPNQQAPFQGEVGKLWGTFAVFFILLGIAHMIATGLADKQSLYQNTSDYTAPQKDQISKSPPFEISKTSNVLINTVSPVANDWVEVSYSLVNEETQQTYDVVAPIEYYYGTDSDGPWNEGGQSNSEYIASAVPPGNYRLLYEVDSGYFDNRLSPRPIAVSFEVLRDVPSSGNFWWTVILLLAYPLYIACRTMFFENKRWSQSDYGPNGNVKP